MGACTSVWIQDPEAHRGSWRALMPEAEMAGLIVELRSATAGVGSFSARFDHLAELAGKPADAVVAAQAMAQAR